MSDLKAEILYNRAFIFVAIAIVHRLLGTQLDFIAGIFFWAAALVTFIRAARLSR